MARDNVQLLIIDPQNDFCDLPQEYCPSGGGLLPALPVAGAHADMQRLAAMIDAGRDGLSGIVVTLDSHQHLDIAHPTFWRTASGDAVAPFTAIAADDVRAGRMLPRLPQAKGRVLAYLEALEATGRYAHMVWPVHCEIGTWGHNIHHDLRLACNRWEERHVAIVSKVIKGANPWTEHYSAIMAEVPDPDDVDTQLNLALIEKLRAADRVFVAGEAGSHCVKATVEHLVEYLPEEQSRKLVLISDCISPVSGFEAHYAGFLSAMQARGVGVARAEDVVSELVGNAGKGI